MKISFTPQVNDLQLTLSRKSKNILVVNGESYDFKQLPEGGKLPAEAVDNVFFQGDITRVAGELEFVIRLPIGEAASQEECFPTPVIVTVNGVIKLPGGAK